MYDVPFFDRFARLYDAVMPAADPAPVQRALQRAERDIETVVEVGGGSGRVAAVLGSDPLIVDASRGMLRRARAKGAPVVQGDAGRLPLGSKTADAVVIVDAFHHFPDPGSTVAEAARILRPGGVLVIRDFDPGTLRGKAIDISERLLRFGSTFYGPTEMEDLLAEAGFVPNIQERGFTYTVVGIHEGPKVVEDGGNLIP